MVKAGDGYMQLVATVEQALDPGAEVRYGQLVKGPDGQRDMDVEVRGSKDGQPHRVIIECKDCGRPVGIGVMDACHSKREDLKPDAFMVYSNSGFTDPALSKAKRVNIQLASAIRQGDPRIKVSLQEEYFSRGFVIDDYRTELGLAKEDNPQGHPKDLPAEHLSYKSLPVLSWANSYLLNALTEHASEEGIQFSDQLTAQVFFKQPTRFDIRGNPIYARHIAFTVRFHRQWVSTIVSLDASLGRYDHHERRIAIPIGESFTLTTDPKFTKDVTKPPDQYVGYLHMTTPMQLSLTILRGLTVVDGKRAPNLEEIIGRTLVAR